MGRVTITFLQTDREGGEVRLIGGGGMQGKGREIMGLLIYDRGIVKYQLWKLASLFSDNQDI